MSFNLKKSVLFFIGSFSIFGNVSHSEEKTMVSPITLETVVNAPKSQVWNDWTTSEGVKSFVVPDANIELVIGGKYEFYFDQEQPNGLQGSEGCKVLSFLPEEMLSFSWNAPPVFPVERLEYTWVVIQLTDLGNNKTKVRLTHMGWREGGRRLEVREYFTKAWPHVFKGLEEKYNHRE